MANTTGKQTGRGLPSSSVEELQLRNIELVPASHSVPTPTSETIDLPRWPRPQVSTQTSHYSSFRSNDQRPLLEHGTSKTSTFQSVKEYAEAGNASTQERVTPGNRRYTSSVAPLRRFQTYVTDRMSGSPHSGWRMGVLFGCCMSVFVLCCNITLLVVGAAYKGGYSEGVADLVYGDDPAITRWNTAIHVFINILGSCLLAGSNYTMQVISSPTREEIDRMHGQGGWLAVGMLSTRNWKCIARKRAFLCLLLGLSSIPLHLFYNATTFRVIVQNRYVQRAISIESPEYASFATNTSYVNLTNNQWKSEFAEAHTMAYRDLVLVLDELVLNSTAEDAEKSQQTFNVTFRDTMYGRDYIAAAEISASDWLVYESYTGQTSPVRMHITHAFAGRTRIQSRIQLSLYYLVVVIAANLMKLFVMLSVLMMDHGHSKYIVTLGDAAASFLSNPDAVTEGRCLLEDGKLIKQTRAHESNSGNATSTSSHSLLDTLRTREWHGQTISYFALIRNEQARLTFLAVLSLIALLLGFVATTTGKAWLWGASSDGALSFSSDNTSAAATLFNAWLANMPQVLLSFCYMNLNSFCTAITSAKEWNNLSTTRKGLRVSEPKGQQRSTYFLQLPYRWAVPLIVLSTALHWLLSQTFFLVRIDVFSGNGDLDTKSSRSACGVSTSSFIVFFTLFLGLCITIRQLASRKFVIGLPQAASNSLIISAACHPPIDEVDPHLEAVQWGVVEGEVVKGFGHCSLSSRPVTAPEEGKIYY